jgi:hypothetical protein
MPIAADPGKSRVCCFRRGGLRPQNVCLSGKKGRNRGTRHQRNANRTEPGKQDRQSLPGSAPITAEAVALAVLLDALTAPMRAADRPPGVRALESRAPDG